MIGNYTSLHPLEGHFLMYMTKCLVGSPEYKQILSLNYTHLEYMKFHSLYGNHSWILKNEGVWGSRNEQFGAHEKLSWGGKQGRAMYAKLAPG